MNRLIDGVQETACIGYADVKAKMADGEEFGGYSLGFHAPKEGSEDSWFGYGGAWGTNCRVNWHQKQLTLWQDAVVEALVNYLGYGMERI